MANTLTDLKDIKIAQTALLPWMQTLLPLSSFSTNFSPSAADKLDTIKVPIVGAPSASSDFAGDYTQNADSQASTTSVTLNRHKYKTVHMTALEASTLAVPLLEKLVSTAAQQLAQDVLTDILSCVTSANFGTTGIPEVDAESFTYRDVIKMREACGKANMPISPRSLILDSSHYSALLADDIVAKSFVTNLAAPSLIEGTIQRLAGFNVIETNCIPENAERLAGFAVHPSAIAIAMRYLQPVADYMEAGAVTDPTTGLTFGYKRYSTTTSDKVYITLEALYGFKAIRKEAIKRICKPE